MPKAPRAHPVAHLIPRPSAIAEAAKAQASKTRKVAAAKAQAVTPRKAAAPNPKAAAPTRNPFAHLRPAAGGFVAEPEREPEKPATYGERTAAAMRKLDRMR